MVRVMLLEVEEESGAFMGDCFESAATSVFKRFRIKGKFERERCTCFSDLFVPGMSTERNP